MALVSMKESETSTLVVTLNQQMVELISKQVQLGNIEGSKRKPGKIHTYDFYHKQENKLITITCENDDPFDAILQDLSKESIKIKQVNERKLAAKTKLTKVAIGVVAVGIAFSITVVGLTAMIQAENQVFETQGQQSQEYIQRLDDIARANGDIPLSYSIEEANPNLGRGMKH